MYVSATNKGLILHQTGFHRTVEEVLQAPKIIHDSITWRDRSHGDYVSCDLRVIAAANPLWRLRLSMTAHVRRLRRKCSFMLIYGERIFALDVNPARAHSNITGESILATHWTRWPCDSVQPDHRDLMHSQWFNEFLARANISFLGKYERPPYMPEQMEIWT